MAKVNPVKLKQDADKLEKSGKLDQAIVLYRQIAEDNPRDWNTINKIGDLFAKLNKPREASAEYAKVADFYTRDGFLLKAIAIWKKINKLDASALEPYLQLADLYAKQGLMMEAKSQYQYVVDEHIKRGKNREAGDVLKKMAEIDPGDLKIRSKLADLYTREGSAGKAVEEHIAIAEELNRKGHLAEALQVLEKGLKLDSRSVRLRVELGRAHTVQKNHEKAAQFLEEAVRLSPGDNQVLARLGEAYLGGRKIDEAEAIFSRLIELNPADDESRIQMGRVHLLRDAFDQAYEQFVPAVDHLVAQREGDRAVALLQQITQKDASHVASLAKLVDVYKTLQKEAPLLAACSQLTEAYIKKGLYGEAASVLEFLVAREPFNQQHKTKLEMVRGRLGGGGARPGAASDAGPPLELVEEEFELDSDQPALAAPPAARASPAAPAARPVAPSRPPIAPSGPLSDEEKEFIEEHLAEGKVFRKYGLVDKAVDQFEAVVARFPDNVEARLEIKELLKEKGQLAKVAEQSYALAEIYRLRGDEASAKQHEAEARQLAPEAAPEAAPAPAAALPAEEELPLEEVAPEIAVAADEEIPVEVEEAGIEPPAAPVPEAFDLGEEQGAAEEELPVRFIEEAAAEEAPAPEVGFSLDQEEEEITLEEPAPAPPPPKPAPARPAPAPPKPAAPPVAKAIEPPRAAPPAPKPAAAPPAPKPAPPKTPAKPAPPVAAPRPAPPAPKAKPEPPRPAAPAAPPDLTRALEEVEQYISLGFVDDARDALRELVGRYPGHPLLADKVAELGLEAEEAEAPAAEPEAPAASADADDAFAELGLPGGEEAAERSAMDDLLGARESPAEDGPGRPGPAAPAAFAELEPGGLDLGSELGDLFGAQSAVEEGATAGPATELGDSGLADIFKEFKKGVDKQLGKEDYDTRYNLGIAYKEMGLVDEAIAEFQLAAKDETRMLECASMLGICFLEKGMPKLAVKWFEKGLKVPGRSDEEYQGLRYDLAVAHEASGETDKALTLFTDLYGQDANFRDVAAKVRELGGGA
jgi:tetratricopeptide (TPR) repeat protein